MRSRACVFVAAPDLSVMGGLFHVLLVAALLFLTPAAPSPTTNFRGISPQDEAYYKTQTIRCKDGSKSFSLDQLNDDYCDCVDGTDEPGTSACPNGRFYCKNKGYTPVEIFSSRVNDGICDCCDGSEEYDGKTKCANTCSQAGKVLKEKLEKKIATFKGGLEVRKRDVEHAKHMIAKEKVELSALKQEEKTLKDHVQKLKAKKEAIEKAEQQEKLKREKEETARKQAEMQDGKGTVTKDETLDSSKDEPNLEDHKEELEEEEVALDADEDIGSSEENIGSSEENNEEALSKEDLGRLVASRWTGENPNIEKEGAGKVEDDRDPESEGIFDDDTDHEHEDEATREDEDDEDDEKDDIGDLSEAEEAAEAFDSTGDDASTKGPWWAKLKDKIKDIFIKSPVDKSEAARVRKDYKDSTSKLTDIQSRISDLEKKLEQDFGKDGEFYGLYGQCFELRIKKYTYKVCPFRHGVQVEGHSTTTLGNWDGFKDDYKSMHFVRGDKCWNGPDRSLKVKLRCGSKIELRDVDEPSRCEYVAELSIPAVCLEERLVMLEQRLHNQGEAPHDEL